MSAAKQLAHAQEFRQALRFTPGDRFAGLDAQSTPAWSKGRKGAEARLEEVGQNLSDLQERLFADGVSGGSKSVLLILQGMDTSGKGGIVRHVVGLVDPQGVSHRGFGKPTPEELSHHYLWRVRNSLPRPGYIGVFDRSHYEDVLTVRVNGIVPKDVWEQRYDEINEFEREIAASGTTIIKVLLNVSYIEQTARLTQRLERPDKFWKYDPSDVDERLQWDDFQAAYQDILDRTNTDIAPWHVVPADNKWYARLAISHLLLEALDGFGLGWPDPTYDLETERARLAASA
ncbi:PPK2 family polyphosphate kinase [Jonesiaceae bacterium BS-20]|uniref:PPK2 family polyphosphate kinase n=1 Tax=Jonesiaceae bacterium BS-20 TaxID=3120821 RepID=A0AAU7E0J6_9MICO